MYKAFIRHTIRRHAQALVRARWGRVVDQEDFLDTQKVAAFDEDLARGEARAETTP